MSQQTPQGGSIIGVSSISALVGGAGQTHYTPTKAGILSLMQSTACALGKYNIRCNALLPGTIRTQLNDEDLADEAKRKYMEGRIPLGRLGQPHDLAGPAVFLASDLSQYVVCHVLSNRFMELENMLIVFPERRTNTGGRWCFCQFPMNGNSSFLFGLKYSVLDQSTSAWLRTLEPCRNFDAGVEVRQGGDKQQQCCMPPASECFWLLSFREHL